MRFARAYTLQLLESVPHEDWTKVPAGAPSHLLWQAGHLAVAQYGLMLFRQRGRGEGDVELMPGWLRKKYGKGTDPFAGWSSHRSIFSRLYARSTKLAFGKS